ncbi:hypothetical protein BH11MYX3_BH11MYX3_15580 [soil metagenome]
MRTTHLVLGALLVGGIATAGPAFGPPARPGPPVRKPASVSYTSDQLSALAEASMADKAGDLETAENRYSRTCDDAKQASCYYNLADVQRRMERTKEALESYGKYLEAAPEAADRAEVQKLIERLKQTPPVVTIDGDDPRAVVFVDGVYVGPSPQTLQLTEGSHTFDRIGPTSLEHHTDDLKPIQVRHIQGYGNREEIGNVVLSGSIRRSGQWRDGARDWRIPSRFTLAPGRYETLPFASKNFCNPIAFEVPKGDGVTYVYIDADEPEDGQPRPACLKLEVTTKKLSFPP